MGLVDTGELPAAADPEYALSASDSDEHARLARQSDAHERFTRRLFQRAGIEPGMRVLDVGCGPGDVSFLLSEMVGAEGSVVGVERDEQAVGNARRRAAQAGLENVDFVCGDFRDVNPAGGPFDALAGRFVLQYQADPVHAVRSAARHLRPGGVVVFAEFNMPVDPAQPGREGALWPRTPASQQVTAWIYEAFGRLGTQRHMGSRLLETFMQAGLSPGPDVDAEVATAVGEEAIGAVVELARSLLPTILSAGIATEQEVDVEALPQRLRVSSGPVGPIVCWPTAIGAYATKPKAQ